MDRLENKLLAAGRAETPSDRVPYTFEKRVMARLKGVPEADVAGIWARSLWRACAPCLAVTLLLAAWTGFSPEPQSTHFTQEFENTVLAVVDQDSGPEYGW